MNKKVKILFIITQSDFGGAQKFIFNLNKRLDKSKFETTVCAGPDGNWELMERLSEIGIKTLQLNNLKRKISLVSDIKAVFEILKIIRKIKPDIIFLSSSKAGAIGTIASFLSKLLFFEKHYLIYRIDWAFNDPRPKIERLFYIIIEFLLSRFRDIIIQTNFYDLARAKKFHLKPKIGFRVIYNGIDQKELSFFDKKAALDFLLKEKKVPEFDYVVGNIANFYQTKGLFDWLKVASQLSKELKIIFILIGDGPLKKELEKEAENLGIKERVLFTGQVKDAYKYLPAFDLFLFSSLKEGFPWAILEAMSAGIAILATKVGAIPLLIENERSGLLANPGNIEEIVSKAKEILKDREKRELFALKAKERVKNFSLEKMVKEYEDLFLKIKDR